MQSWFQAGEREPEAQPPRVDHYLRMDDTDALGIKLRQGRIEIKQRQRQHGVVRFHERVAGQVEQWRKWSLPLAQADGLLPHALVPPSAWIGVQKERQLLKYAMFPGGRIIAVPVGGFAARGGHLELTRIGVGDHVWWSLGLETLCEEDDPCASLLAVAGHVFAREPVPLLLDDDSYGYPRWLSNLIRA